MADTEVRVRRRRRPAVSCTLCRKRKIRCDKELPCNHCKRSRNNEACIYENGPAAPLPNPPVAQTALSTPDSLTVRQHRVLQWPPSPDTSSVSSHRPTRDGSQRTGLAVSGSTTASSPVTDRTGFPHHVVSDRNSNHNSPLHNEVTQRAPSAVDDGESANVDNASPTTREQFSTLFGQATFSSNCVMHKSRLFGQSNMISNMSLFRGSLEMIEPALGPEHARLPVHLIRCKHLARVIKKARLEDDSIFQNGKLPPKSLVDSLVSCYMRTLETTYRVLHIPTFRSSYEDLWNSPAEDEKKTPFILQLKLIMAIGAAVHDDSFSLRATAAKWIHEAHSWVSSCSLKPQVTIEYIQTEILLLLAREVVNIGPATIWIEAGALVRKAVSLGLHRDPSRLPKMSLWKAEMSRRLWNTIVEINLHFSMEAGTPPLVSTDDFDTEPPRNFDDEQLCLSNSEPRLEGRFTDTSTAIAFRKTLLARLAICGHLNRIKYQANYQETLRLDAALRTQWKELRRAFNHPSDSSSDRRPSVFETSLVDFHIHHYLVTLHAPFLGQAFHQTTYAYSRKAILDSCITIWYMTRANSAHNNAEVSSWSSPRPVSQDFIRLVSLGSGFLHDARFRLTFLVAAEVSAQLQEEVGLGPPILRPDLFQMILEGKTRLMESIKAGETNIKGYIVTCLLTTIVDHLRQQGDPEKLPLLLLDAAAQAGVEALAVLEDQAGTLEADATEPEDLMSGLLPQDKLLESDDLLSQFLFGFGDTEPGIWDNALQPMLATSYS